MKSFRTFIAVAVLIIATWTVHYIQIANAKHDDTMATIETISGDDQLLQDVFIEGTLNNNHNYSPFLMRNGEIEPVAYSSFGRPIPQLFQTLIQEEKAFMRGKMLNPLQFYQDHATDTLLYIDTQAEYGTRTLTITADLLKDEEANAFTVETAIDETIAWATTMRSTIYEDTLYVFISVQLDGGAQRLYKASIDLQAKQLIAFDSLLEAMSTEEINRFITAVNDPLSITSNPYIAYMTGEQHATDRYDMTTVQEDVHVFNAVTNDTTTVSLTDHASVEADERRIVVQNNLLLLVMIQDGQLHIDRYNLDTQKWLSAITITAPSDILPIASLSVTATDDFLYTIAATEEGQVLAIVDPATGEIGYLGALHRQSADTSMLSMTYVTNK